jgi:integrase
MLQRKGAAELAIQGAKTDKQVEAIRDSLAGGLEKAQPEPPAASKTYPKGAPTAKTVADIYITYCRRERKPRHAYDVEKRLKPWLEHVGESTPLAALTRENFKSYRAHLLDQVKVREEWEAKQKGPISPKQKQHAPGLSVALFNNMLAVVKGAFTAAEREEGITALHLPSFVKVLKSKKTKQTDRPIFSPDDIARMLASFDNKWKAMALLSLNTAATNVDLAEIPWTAVNFKKGILDYRRAKNGNIRRLPLWQRTLRALTAHQPDAEKRNGLMFLSESGTPFITYSQQEDETGRPKLTPNDNLAKQFRLKRDALGLSEHLTWGTFRKSAATIANRENDRDTVQMLLGDASAEVWKRYAMTESEGKLRKATSEIEQFYFPPKRKAKSKQKPSGSSPSSKKREPKQ